MPAAQIKSRARGLIATWFLKVKIARENSARAIGSGGTGPMTIMLISRTPIFNSLTQQFIFTKDCPEQTSLSVRCQKDGSGESLNCSCPDHVNEQFTGRENGSALYRAEDGQSRDLNAVETCVTRIALPDQAKLSKLIPDKGLGQV